jgi:hypothetical protein
MADIHYFLRGFRRLGCGNHPLISESSFNLAGLSYDKFFPLRVQGKFRRAAGR